MNKFRLGILVGAVAVFLLIKYIILGLILIGLGLVGYLIIKVFTNGKELL